MAEDNGSGIDRLGVLAALVCYGTWGGFPILFRALDHVPPLIVVADRVVWSLLVMWALLAFRGRMGEVRAALGDPTVRSGMLAAAALLAVNWLVFVWAVGNHHVLEVSFGYFINPLVSVAIGMVFLGERLTRLQQLSIGIALLAVGVQALGVGGVPVVSLTLAVTFGFYGYFRKTVNVASAPGLFVETLLMLPLALGFLFWLFATEGPGVHADPWTMFLLVLTGPATTLALVMFAFAARRLSLTMVGMFQYLAPSAHFLIAIYLFGEPTNWVQLASFVLIWVSLFVFTMDSFRRRSRRIAPAHG